MSVAIRNLAVSRVPSAAQGQKANTQKPTVSTATASSLREPELIGSSVEVDTIGFRLIYCAQRRRTAAPAFKARAHLTDQALATALGRLASVTYPLKLSSNASSMYFLYAGKPPANATGRRGLPGMFAPIHQLSVSGMRVAA